MTDRHFFLQPAFDWVGFSLKYHDKLESWYLHGRISRVLMGKGSDQKTCPERDEIANAILPSNQPTEQPTDRSTDQS